MHLPHVGAPEDETERRQLRATYHGAQKEVDDQLAHLFDYLEATGLADSTLVVLTSDHGEMGGDHWLLEKVGYWDESFHVPLIIRDPDPAASPTRGRVVHSFTESVDVLPTICAWLGIEVPLQADGFALQPFITGERSADGPITGGPRPTGAGTSPIPSTGMAERYLGVPMAHSPSTWSGARTPSTCSSPPTPTCSRRSCSTWTADPGQLHDLVGSGAASELGWQAAQTPPAVAHAQRRRDPGGHHAHHGRPGRRPRRMALIVQLCHR